MTPIIGRCPGGLEANPPDSFRRKPLNSGRLSSIIGLQRRVRPFGGRRAAHRLMPPISSISTSPSKPPTRAYTDAEIMRRIDACPKLASLQSINRALAGLVNSEQSYNSQIA
jgi:hypothetical protein